MRDALLRPIGYGLLVKINVEGVENVPTTGPTLVVINHIAAIDPFVVVGLIHSRFVVPMSKIENFNHPLVSLIARSWGVFPVRRGEPDREALASSLALMEQDYPVLMAPEGTRRPALHEAKDGMTYLAARSNAMIVPVGVDGTEGFPGTLKRLRRTPVQVRFGRPFRLRTGGQRRIPRDDLHRMTTQAMYQMAALLPPHRRGFYADLDQAETDLLEFVTP